MAFTHSTRVAHGSSMTIQSKLFVRPQIDLHYTSASQEIRSLPDLIVFNARRNPDHVFGVQMHSSGSESTHPHMTFSSLHIAVERTSSWLVHCGVTRCRSSREDEVSPVAVLLGSDVSIFIYMAALLRLGTPVRMTGMFPWFANLMATQVLLYSHITPSSPLPSEKFISRMCHCHLCS